MPHSETMKSLLLQLKNHELSLMEFLDKKREWNKSKKYNFRVCKRCNKTKELCLFKGMSKYCKGCKWYKKAMESKIIAKQKRKRYLNSEKGKEYKKAKDLNYRSRKRASSDNTVTLKSLTQLLSNQNFLCVICKTYIKQRNTRHLDHIIPVSKEGKHSLNNVQWLCCKCNILKSNNYEK